MNHGANAVPDSFGDAPPILGWNRRRIAKSPSGVAGFARIQRITGNPDSCESSYDVKTDFAVLRAGIAVALPDQSGYTRVGFLCLYTTFCGDFGMPLPLAMLPLLCLGVGLIGSNGLVRDGASRMEPQRFPGRSRTAKSFRIAKKTEVAGGSAPLRRLGPGDMAGRFSGNGFASRPKAPLPLALAGYDIVPLRDQQQWRQGLKSLAATYDGQRYFFSSARHREIFLAAPSRYVPALGGRCMVTFAESGRRVAGDLKYGVLYQGRIYLFSDAVHQRRFQEEPGKYRDADLANSGNCPVTQQDQKRKVPGLPETVCIYRGYRCLFANIAARNKFIESPGRYVLEKTEPAPGECEKTGVRARPIMGPPASVAISGQDTNEGSARPKRESRGADAGADAGADSLSAAGRLPAPVQDSQEIPRETAPLDDLGPLTMEPALGGYCPVSIRGDGRNLGIWVEGNKRFHAVYDGKFYLFAGAREKSQFLAAPQQYIPALGGECVVCFRDLGKEVHGSIFYAALYQGRLFLFADTKQKEMFRQDPTVYAQVDLAMDGKCAVSQREEGRLVAGKEEEFTWYHNRRYLFASPEYRRKFIVSPERYVGH